MRKSSKLREAVRLAEKLMEYSRNIGSQIREQEIRFAAHLIDVKGANGVYRGVFILDDCVVKFPRYQDRVDEISSEASFIRMLRAHPKFGRHFPRTRFLTNGVTVQERCDPNDELYDKYYRSIELLAKHLRIHDDLHARNVGWRYEESGPVPVFIDVEIRSSNDVPEQRETKRSWELV